MLAGQPLASKAGACVVRTSDLRLPSETLKPVFCSGAVPSATFNVSPEANPNGVIAGGVAARNSGVRRIVRSNSDSISSNETFTSATPSAPSEASTVTL